MKLNPQKKKKKEEERKDFSSPATRDWISHPDGDRSNQLGRKLYQIEDMR